MTDDQSDDMKPAAAEGQLVLVVCVDGMFAAPPFELAEVRLPRGDLVLDGLGDIRVDVHFVPDVQKVRLDRRVKFSARFDGQRLRYFGERAIDTSLPCVAKGEDRCRVVRLRVSLAAIVGADSVQLSVPLDQVVKELESDSALRADVVGAACGFSLLDEAERSELGQAHPIRSAAAFDVRNERLNTIARHGLMTPGTVSRGPRSQPKIFWNVDSWSTK